MIMVHENGTTRATFGPIEWLTLCLVLLGGLGLLGGVYLYADAKFSKLQDRFDISETAQSSMISRQFVTDSKVDVVQKTVDNLMPIAASVEGVKHDISNLQRDVNRLQNQNYGSRSRLPTSPAPPADAKPDP